MPFFLYEYEVQNSHEHFTKIGGISLAGYNAIHSLWKKKGKPINTGWRITLDELIEEITNAQHNSKTRKIVIDWAPSAKDKIGLMELLDIYLYTEGDSDKGRADWSPMMWELAGVLNEDYPAKLTPNQKEERIIDFSVPLRNTASESKTAEFLYLSGDKEGWKFGRIGQVNAVFIYGDARKYFRQFF